MSFSMTTRADEADKHRSDINTLLYHKNKLYSGADDGKIKVWRKDLTLIKTIDAHSRAVMALAANDDTLYSCSRDGKVKEWSLHNLKKKGTILIHRNEIWSLCYDDNTLYVGDNHGSLKVFVDDKVAARVRLTDPVKYMMVIGNLVYTVRDSNLVINEMFADDTDTFSRSKTIPGRSPMCIAGDKICFSSTIGKDILVHENSTDLEFKEFTQIKDAHDMTINSLCGVQNEDETLLYSGGADKVIKQWKITRTCVTKMNACLLGMVINAVTTGSEGQLYVGCENGHIVRVDA